MEGFKLKSEVTSLKDTVERGLPGKAVGPVRVAAVSYAGVVVIN